MPVQWKQPHETHMVAASSSALVIRCGKSFHRSSTSWDPPGAAATRSARAPKMIQCNGFETTPRAGTPDSGPESIARNLALCRRWWYKSRRDMSPPADVQRQRRASSHKYTASFASRARILRCSSSGALSEAAHALDCSSFFWISCSSVKCACDARGHRNPVAELADLLQGPVGAREGRVRHSVSSR